MRPFKRDEIILLLGAGASKDAGILHSTDMVREIEKLIESEWSEYRPLYNYVKSSIFYSSGVRGRFDKDVNYNIESIVNILDELTKKEHHPLYPFVGSWNPKLLEVAGVDFENLRNFRRKIVQQLRDKWISLDYAEDADYYGKLMDLQKKYEYPLRVFTLNYDLCVEQHVDTEILERGFEIRYWDWRLFELDNKNIYLYKVHGSTDWVREDDGRLTYKLQPSNIDHDKAELIFGTTYKLQSVDPYLFFVYEFRKWTLIDDARLIVSIGYGFGDEHINKILGQALRSNREKRLLSVTPLSADAVRAETQKIERSLEVGRQGQVTCWNLTAKEFMLRHLTIEVLASKLFDEERELFPEIIPAA